MMNNSERKIILMVNSKFKQTTIYFLAKISEFDHVIIDNLVPKPFIEDLRNFSKNLIIAKPLFWFWYQLFSKITKKIGNIFWLSRYYLLGNKINCHKEKIPIEIFF